MIKPLWDFLAVSEPPDAADVIFVFGCRDFAVPARAAELYHDRYAPKVLVSGHEGRLTRGVFDKPEAVVFKDRLVAAGVPTSAVLTEPEASNTLENVRLGMAVLERNGAMVTRALLVAKGFVMRRCLATFQQQFAGVDIRACPPTGGLDAALDRSGTAFAARLAAEIERLDRYAAKGDIRTQRIPEDVRLLARAVAKRYPSELGEGGSTLRSSSGAPRSALPRNCSTAYVEIWPQGPLKM